MSRRKQLAVAACALAAVAVAGWLALRPSGPTHEGRTVEEWFEEYAEVATGSVTVSAHSVEELDAAFKALGTNMTPYLAGLIVQPQSESWDYWSFRFAKLRQSAPDSLRWLVPRLHHRANEGVCAATLFSYGEMPARELIPLLKPALDSTNAHQRANALMALESVSADFPQAGPYLERGLQDADPYVQGSALSTITALGAKGWRAETTLVSQLFDHATREDAIAEKALQALIFHGDAQTVVALQEHMDQIDDPSRQRMIARTARMIQLLNSPEPE
jgi:HEAT repeat protein